MTNNVDITLAADDKSAERAIDQLNSKLQKTEQRLDKMRMVSRQTSSASQAGFKRSSDAVNRLGMRITGVIGGLLSFRRGVQAIGQEWDETAKKAEAARQATLDPAKALRTAKFNFNPDETLTKQEFEPAVFDLAKKTSAPVGTVATVLQDALSAKGSATARQVFQAAEEALKIEAENADFAKTLASGFLDIAKFSGTKDISQIPGLLLQTQAASRVTDPGKVGANLLPGVAGLVMQGETPERAAELMATITQLGIEGKGQTASTGGIALGEQLMNFVPKREGANFVGKDARGKFPIPAEQFAEFDAAKRPSERLEILQRSPELQRAFIGEADFEKRIKEPILAMIRGTEKAKAELQNAQRAIDPIGPKTKAAFQEKLEFADSGDLQASLSAEQESKSRSELHLLQDTPRQRIAFARKELERTLGKIDRPGFDAPMNQVKLMIFDAAMKKLQSRISEGEVVGPPEFVAARALEMIRRKDVPVPFADDMTETDIEHLDEQIEFLRQKGRERGNIMSASQRQAQEKMQEVRQAAGVSNDFIGPVFDPRTAETRREMQEQTRLLKKISDQGDRPSPPRQTQPPAARLSRSN